VGELRANRADKVLGRAGPENGGAKLLTARTGLNRPVRVVLARTPFELADSSQEKLSRSCQALAGRRWRRRFPG
jgi:hypothetical protein